MRCIFRFYKKYDLDILAVLSLSATSAVGLIKEALTAYVSGQGYTIVAPIGVSIEELPSKKSVTVEIEDVRVIDWLSTVRQGYKTSAVKCVIRHYLSSPIPDVFLEGGITTTESVKRSVVEQGVDRKEAEIKAKVKSKAEVKSESVSEVKTEIKSEVKSDSTKADFKGGGQSAADLFDTLDNMVNSF